VRYGKPWFLYPYVYFVGNCVFFVYFLVFFFVCYVCVDIELYCAGWICDC
jgi:hypothetical protein